MEASEKIEYVQQRSRAQAKQENRESRTKQRELFSSDNDIQDDEKKRRRKKYIHFDADHNLGERLTKLTS